MIREELQRINNDTVKIPNWLMPLVLTIVVIISGVAFKGLAAKEAKALDKPHLESSAKKFDKVESELRGNDHRITVIEVNVGHLTKTVEETNDIVNSMSKIVSKIANKMNID